MTIIIAIVDVTSVSCFLNPAPSLPLSLSESVQVTLSYRGCIEASAARSSDSAVIKAHEMSGEQRKSRHISGEAVVQSE